MYTPLTVQSSPITLFSDIDRDIIKSHVLTRLDGPTLASVGSSSSYLNSLSSSPRIWTAVCHSAFPSTATSPHLLLAFPGGPRKFFYLSSTLLLPAPATSATSPPPPELISFVDVFYKDALVFSRVQATETVSEWFRCSPFRIDLLGPKDVFQTAEGNLEDDMACESVGDEMLLSWVLVDLEGGRAANLSSHKPVSVQRHWLTGQIQVRFATILVDNNGGLEPVQCETVVTCITSERGGMQVRMVSLQMEDIDGIHLVGKDSLVLLHRALESKRGNYRGRKKEGRRRYKEYLEMKKEKIRAEGVLGTQFLVFLTTMLVVFGFWVVYLCRP